MLMQTWLKRALVDLRRLVSITLIIHRFLHLFTVILRNIIN